MMRPHALLLFSFLLALLIALTALAQANTRATATSSPAGAVALAPPDANADLITPEQIEGQIAQIQGYRFALGTSAQRAKLNEVSAYIHETLAGYGLAVTDDPVTYSGQSYPNIVGRLTGTVCPEKTFIVGAHYDGAPNTPGADDNASGAAGMLEIARVLSSESFPASIDFVAFSFEEEGLVGSRQMAAAAEAAGRELVGMFSLEMIGYTCNVEGCQSYPAGIPPARPTGDFITAIGNTASSPLLNRFAAAAASAVPSLPVVPFAVPGNGETLPDVRRSDHAPFWDHGYQALLINDTSNYRNHNYHQPSDTLDTLDLGFAASVANASAAAVADSLSADENADGFPDVCGSSAPIGGIAEEPQPERVGAFGNGGPSTTRTVVLGGLAAVGGALLLVGVGWRARRRWLR